MDEARWKKGYEVYRRLTGKEENLFAGMGDFSDLIMEFVCGEIYARGTLTWKERQIATLAVLGALGWLPQMKIHMKIALNVGMTETEIEEMLIHIAVYAGFPAAMNGYRILGEIREEAGNRDG
ncbi:carboxymuconolactone decarboxylase family protein [Papillibacter cinnamivorans]|uniref:4-carboxymuconolactone decarboxylase n=1 Tax=Papillibacter cinnamivorans DSM 12816 TaxID=1122930 RepID=A0A1W2AJK8_9FIRM|nr:carboxymuconolactone decarboxylase family protein [Papillibacter cinnamivorans]SMC60438.1 4-carboxymuconolactone decarboxylase [Papillibacter cinnamivorans DSM 12816]